MIGLRSGPVGVRFTILYAVVFLLSGIGLLGLTFLLFDRGRSLHETVPVGSLPAQDGLVAAQQRIGELRSGWPR